MVAALAQQLAKSNDRIVERLAIAQRRTFPEPKKAPAPRPFPTSMKPPAWPSRTGRCPPERPQRPDDEKTPGALGA